MSTGILIWAIGIEDKNTISKGGSLRYDGIGVYHGLILDRIYLNRCIFETCCCTNCELCGCEKYHDCAKSWPASDKIPRSRLAAAA